MKEVKETGTCHHCFKYRECIKEPQGLLCRSCSRDRDRSVGDPIYINILEEYEDTL